MGIKCHTEEFKIEAVKQNRINICICTYLRSESLLKCLHSLALIECPANTDVVITVIDNDELGSANEIVTSLIDGFPFALFYHIEPKRGIPCARNRAVDETLKLNCEYLAFIDDDEWVEPDWLIRLYGFCQKHGGDVIVSGSVVSELPAAMPEHIRGLFNKKEKLTGSHLSSCATNNVLVPTLLTKNTDLRFDETNPLAGGEDTIFFCKAVGFGAVILKCAEAVVHETIPANRLSLKWMAKRKYGAGITVAWRKQQNGRSRLSIACSAAIQMLFDVARATVMLFVGKKLRRNMFGLNVCRSVGVLAGLLGVRVDSYRKTDGR